MESDKARVSIVEGTFMPCPSSNSQSKLKPTWVRASERDMTVVSKIKVMGNGGRGPKTVSVLVDTRELVHPHLSLPCEDTMRIQPTTRQAGGTFTRNRSDLH